MAAAAIRVTRAADSAPPTNSSSRQVGILQAKHKLRCLLSEALALISPGASHPELPGSEATVTGLTASSDSCWFDKLILSISLVIRAPVHGENVTRFLMTQIIMIYSRV